MQNETGPLTVDYPKEIINTALFAEDFLDTQLSKIVERLRDVNLSRISYGKFRQICGMYGFSKVHIKYIRAILTQRGMVRFNKNYIYILSSEVCE